MTAHPPLPPPPPQPILALLFSLFQDVDVAFFAVGWFQTLFLYNSRMPSDTLLWLWDNWVTERSYKVCTAVHE